MPPIRSRFEVATTALRRERQARASVACSALARVVERDSGLVTLLADPVELRLAAGAVEWPVAKAANLSKSHGVHITAERLEEMAASYDPERIEAAPINFDHEPAGPAHGWIARAAVRGGVLWVSPIELSKEMVEGVRGGRYKRASIEFTTKHPTTGGWYLSGLAVLGNAKPAIKALPPLRLSAPRHVLQLTAADGFDDLSPERIVELRERYGLPAVEATREKTLAERQSFDLDDHLTPARQAYLRAQYGC